MQSLGATGIRRANYRTLKQTEDPAILTPCLKHCQSILRIINHTEEGTRSTKRNREHVQKPPAKDEGCVLSHTKGPGCTTLDITPSLLQLWTEVRVSLLQSLRGSLWHYVTASDKMQVQPCFHCSLVTVRAVEYLALWVMKGPWHFLSSGCFSMDVAGVSSPV